MTISERFWVAASRILEGDESAEAARILESVVVDEYLGEESIEELLDGLALYSPGNRTPYVDAPELRELIRIALVQMGDPSTTQ